MENRRPVHYKKNTIEPHIGKKCKDLVKKNKGKKVFYLDDGKQMRNPNKKEKKVVATTICNWCDADFKGKYFTICPMCHNCQYCGFYSPIMNDCLSCLNEAPEEIRVKYKRIKLL